MRKIAGNYILLPGYPLVKNGYVLLDGGEVAEVVDTGGVIREIQGLEFYGGMIVAGNLAEKRGLFGTGENLLPVIAAFYREAAAVSPGLAIIKGADLKRFEWLAATTIERLV